MMDKDILKVIDDIGKKHKVVKKRIPKRLPTTISEEELVKVLKATKLEHHKVAFAILFYQGFRISELVKLQQEDIDRSMKIIRVKMGKGSKDRDVVIMKECFRLLNKLPIKCGVRALQISFNKVTEKTLGKKLNIHTLRHSCITWMINKKKFPLPYVQRQAGHSRIDTTMIYTHIKPQDIVDFVWE